MDQPELLQDDIRLWADRLGVAEAWRVVLTRLAGDRRDLLGNLGRKAMISVMAVYENGILKPHEPLELTEGQTVQLAIYPQIPLKPLRPRTPEEEDFDRRLKAAKTLEEAFAVMDTAPQSAEDFDIIKAMNETRRLTGFRMLDPEPAEGAAL